MGGVLAALANELGPNYDLVLLYTAQPRPFLRKQITKMDLLLVREVFLGEVLPFVNLLKNLCPGLQVWAFTAEPAKTSVDILYNSSITILQLARRIREHFGDVGPTFVHIPTVPPGK
jgi:hypothetical protein